VLLSVKLQFALISFFCLVSVLKQNILMKTSRLGYDAVLLDAPHLPSLITATAVHQPLSFPT